MEISLVNLQALLKLALRKKCLCLELFWFVLSANVGKYQLE